MCTATGDRGAHSRRQPRSNSSRSQWQHASLIPGPRATRLEIGTLTASTISRPAWPPSRDVMPPHPPFEISTTRCPHTLHCRSTIADIRDRTRALAGCVSRQPTLHRQSLFGEGCLGTPRPEPPRRRCGRLSQNPLERRADTMTRTLVRTRPISAVADWRAGDRQASRKLP